METKIFIPNGVCSKRISFDYDENNMMYNLSFIGGCDGNLKAIGRLCEGMPMDVIYNKLSGNLCKSKNTSCADQLAKAIKEVLDNK